MVGWWGGGAGGWQCGAVAVRGGGVVVRWDGAVGWYTDDAEQDDHEVEKVPDSRKVDPWPCIFGDNLDDDLTHEHDQNHEVDLTPCNGSKGFVYGWGRGWALEADGLGVGVGGGWSRVGPTVRPIPTGCTTHYTPYHTQYQHLTTSLVRRVHAIQRYITLYYQYNSTT